MQGIEGTRNGGHEEWRIRGMEDTREGAREDTGCEERGHEEWRMRGIEDAKNGGHEGQMTRRIEDSGNTGLEEWRMQ